MVSTLIKNGSVVTPNAILKDADVLIKGPKIAAVGKVTKDRGCPTIDAKGLFVAPGFIDTHIHGDPKAVLAHEVKYGTTAILPALSCDSLDRIYARAEEIRRFAEEDPLGKAILGVRLEGPYINKRRAGAQDRQYIKKPSIKELSQIIKGTRPLLKIITIAPELKGVRPLLMLLKKAGVIASIGHSDATYEEALAGFDSGITHATHLFNAMSGFDGGARHKDRRASFGLERGVATAALVDGRVYAEVILDSIHFHPMLFRLLVKVKDLSKIILITDSVRAEYKSYPQSSRRLNVGYGNGAYRFPGGRIAGSALTMMQAVKNAIKAGGLSVVDAVRCATQNPARLLGIDSRKGAIAAGKDADIVVFDKDFDVKMTLIGGKIIRCAE